jgi:2-polyprenyl-6-methoxyphenol hydroxylase-like FAD-dependent oxidoreductase
MRIGIMDTVTAQWSGRLPQGHALVIGGSVGGLFAAHRLRGAGWDIAMLGRAPATWAIAAPGSAHGRSCSP